jgi:SWI/SNF-related matrix-associated actin-dependent regulator of chromatin subfamily A3
MADDDGADLTQEHQVQICKLYSNIVGKRFYTEPLHDGEIIYLVREPRNPYDSNAIKVESRNHQQVGHISAASAYPNMAACLSQIVDFKLPEGAGGTLEAVSVAGAKSTYTSVCEITIVSTEANRDTIIKHLKRCNIGFMDLSSNAVYGQFNDLRKRNSVTLESLNSSSQKSSVPTMAENYTLVSQEEVLQSLDNMWDQQENELESLKLGFDLSRFPCMRTYFSTQLFQHQLQGLAWMLDREIVKATVLPPFYEEIVAVSKPNSGSSGPTKKQGSISSFLLNGTAASAVPSSTLSVVTAGKGSKFRHSLTNHVYNAVPDPVAGGIVADTMGMGKSAMILALIVCHRDQKSAGPAAFGSPLEEDIEYLGSSSLDGPEGKSSAKRKASRGRPGSSKKMAPEPSAGKPIILAAGGATTSATLIVCPLSVVSSWLDETSNHFVNAVLLNDVNSTADKNAINICLYHGPNRHNISAEMIFRADIVITTYDVIASEFSLEGTAGGSLLQQFHWWRVVLDESHVIRNMQTRRYKACDSLRSVYRWCVTGTLIINTLADLEAPLRSEHL